MSKKSHSSKKMAKYKHLYMLIFVIISLGAGYYYIKTSVSGNQSEPYITGPISGGEDGKARYTLVENTDSINYEAIVIYADDVGITEIATTFYNDGDFWPYIYLENKASLDNPLSIKKDIVLRIPRLSSKSINIQDADAKERVKQLSDSILNSSTALD